MPAGSPRSVDALVQIAASFLDGKRDTAPVGQRERYQLVLHATSEQLTGDDDQAADGITSDGVRLHPETSRRLACDCPTSTLTGDEDGSPLHLGRRTRRIRGRVARAVPLPRPRSLPSPRLHRSGDHQPPHPAPGARRNHLPDQPDLALRRPPLAGPRRRLDIAVTRPGAWRFYPPDRRHLDTHHAPTRAKRPLPTDPTITPDAVTGHWNGETLQQSQPRPRIRVSTTGENGA
jgi:hypothetical protein